MRAPSPGKLESGLAVRRTIPLVVVTRSGGQCERAVEASGRLEFNRVTVRSVVQGVLHRIARLSFQIFPGAGVSARELLT